LRIIGAAERAIVLDQRVRAPDVCLTGRLCGTEGSTPNADADTAPKHIVWERAPTHASRRRAGALLDTHHHPARTHRSGCAGRNTKDLSVQGNERRTAERGIRDNNSEAEAVKFFIGLGQVKLNEPAL
jgi:hypothetical protein